MLIAARLASAAAVAGDGNSAHIFTHHALQLIESKCCLNSMISGFTHPHSYGTQNVSRGEGGRRREVRGRGGGGGEECTDERGANKEGGEGESHHQEDSGAEHLMKDALCEVRRVELYLAKCGASCMCIYKVIGMCTCTPTNGQTH